MSNSSTTLSITEELTGSSSKSDLKINPLAQMTHLNLRSTRHIHSWTQNFKLEPREKRVAHMDLGFSNYVNWKARVLLVTGSPTKSCDKLIGNHYLLNSIKNKIDYCRWSFKEWESCFVLCMIVESEIWVVLFWKFFFNWIVNWAKKFFFFFFFWIYVKKFFSCWMCMYCVIVLSIWK